MPTSAPETLLQVSSLSASYGKVGVLHGVDLEINWAGRIGVFWIMAGIFFAQVFAGWVPTAFLLFGLFMALIATAIYAREGFRAARSARQGA